MRSLLHSFRFMTAAAAVLALVSVVPAFADTLAYSDPTGQGAQNWGGNLALTFQVNQAITVTRLGVFNANGTNALTIPGTITVGIYDNLGNLLVSTTFTAGTPYAQVNSDLLKSITPITLAPGLYEVDAVGFSSSNANGNLNAGSPTGPVLNNGGGALTFLGAAYDSSTVLDDPTTCSGCQASPTIQRQFDAGTFAYIVTPEPGGLVLLGTGLLSVGAMARRRFLA